MDDQEVDKLFQAMAEKTAEGATEAREVFSLLVSSTLRYRDQMKEQTGVIVTVEDVRLALDSLLQVVITRHVPKIDHAVRANLLKVWLEELAPYL